MFFTIGVLKIFANLFGKHLCWRCNFIKKRLQHRCFPGVLFFHSLLTGGGTSAILRHTQRNKKMLARDRIKHLIDDDYPMLEVGLFAGLGMEYGDICNAGLIVVIAKVSGELCIIGASDATVKGDKEAFVFVI